jgi:ribosomal protein RSM22 (predicted rRNA methylase)
MRLPDELRAAVAEETARIDARQLVASAARLTENYTRGEFSSALTTAADRAAYLAVRMPATYAACAKVFAAVVERTSDARFASLLDLGAGPGTAVWAAAQVIALDQITCIERNQVLLETGQRIASSSSVGAIRSARWLPGDIAQVRDLAAHDIVVVSYVLGEIPESQLDNVIRAAWLKTASLLVIIEPGTPEGFRRVHAARALLIESGAHLAAPCPHHDTCPMFATGDWCHFAARLERTAEHRRLKSGVLGYEDEKFSYIAASKHRVSLPESRVLRHPLIHPGHMRLTLCRPERPESRTVTKSNKALWRYARKLEWGDPWDATAESVAP